MLYWFYFFCLFIRRKSTVETADIVYWFIGPALVKIGGHKATISRDTTAIQSYGLTSIHNGWHSKCFLFVIQYLWKI